MIGIAYKDTSESYAYDINSFVLKELGYNTKLIQGGMEKGIEELTNKHIKTLILIWNSGNSATALAHSVGMKACHVDSEEYDGLVFCTGKGVPLEKTKQNLKNFLEKNNF